MIYLAIVIVVIVVSIIYAIVMNRQVKRKDNHEHSGSKSSNDVLLYANPNFNMNNADTISNACFGAHSKSDTDTNTNAECHRL